MSSSVRFERLRKRRKAIETRSSPSKNKTKNKQNKQTKEKQNEYLVTGAGTRGGHGDSPRTLQTAASVGTWCRNSRAGYLIVLGALVCRSLSLSSALRAKCATRRLDPPLASEASSERELRADSVCLVGIGETEETGIDATTTGRKRPSGAVGLRLPDEQPAVRLPKRRAIWAPLPSSLF